MSALDDLLSADVAVRLAAIETLAAAGTDGDVEVDALGRCLSDRSKAVRRRAADALVTLATRDGRLREPLMAMLGATDPEARWGAAFALGRLGTPPAEVLPVLLETLGRDDGDVRWAAAELLLRIADVVDVRPAVEQLAGVGSAEQRKMALYCLREFGGWSPDRGAIVAGALSDGEPGVRLAGMSLAARCAPDRAGAAALVVRLLDDADAGVRRAAAATLGTIGVASDAVLHGLQVAAGTADAALVRAAERALRTLR